MANIHLIRIENLIDDHQSGRDGGPNRLGLLFQGLTPTLVSLGPVGYVGILSINEVRLEKDGYHLTRNSKTVINDQQMQVLMETGELRISERCCITLLPGILCDQVPGYQGSVRKLAADVLGALQSGNIKEFSCGYCKFEGFVSETSDYTRCPNCGGL